MPNRLIDCSIDIVTVSTRRQTSFFNARVTHYHETLEGGTVLRTQRSDKYSVTALGMSKDVRHTQNCVIMFFNFDGPHTYTHTHTYTRMHAPPCSMHSLHLLPSVTMMGVCV